MKKWNIDPSHTEIGFRVKHMMFTNVKGQFKEYDADIAFDDSLQNASFEFNANVNSIDTNNNDRDNHLRSADFFNVEQFPALKFKSTEVKNNGSDYEIKGDLTIKDVTRPVALKGTISGLMKDPRFNNRMALALEGAIRSDTNNNDRDNHLRSADFFNVEQFPALKFKSTEVKNNGSDYEIKGDLTIKDVTRPVALKGTISGLMKDPWGNNRLALALEGAINRKDFGLTYNAALETGGVLVGEEVKLNIELQLLENK